MNWHNWAAGAGRCRGALWAAGGPRGAECLLVGEEAGSFQCTVSGGDNIPLCRPLQGLLIAPKHLHSHMENVKRVQKRMLQ